MPERRASRTAVIVVQGRAAADGRLAPQRFHDPVAVRLLRPDERATVDLVRADRIPTDFGQRIAFESVRASAEVAVPRTVAIDDAVRSRPTPQLVIVGAGLDDRAWRMAELAQVDVFELDHPASQADKRDRVGELTPVARSVRFVPIDFTRDRLDAVLDAAGHDPRTPSTWIWEGVVPYLTRAEVAATLEPIGRRSAPGSRLIVNYQAPSLRAAAGRWFASALARLARQRSPWADEPRRSSWTPAALAKLLVANVFQVVSDDDLLTLAQGLDLPVRQRVSLSNGRVAIADR
jgi:methyltransferase (TIGR00027 family)